MRMTLTFPNPSRSFDETKNAVRFTGYDGMFEVRFFVEASALSRTSSPAETSEREYLSAFDALRSSIQGVAKKAYSQGRRQSYTITAADLR
jgi:hypothetical protein